MGDQQREEIRSVAPMTQTGWSACVIGEERAVAVVVVEEEEVVEGEVNVVGEVRSDEMSQMIITLSHSFRRSNSDAAGGFGGGVSVLVSVTAAAREGRAWVLLTSRLSPTWNVCMTSVDNEREGAVVRVSTADGMGCMSKSSCVG